ncbi:hypothetical protein [Polyangium sp. y55x31]|uniref:hypothetical protein n=1 Tax=Polyangium sp. y55x31 TaxID=3042688 RepID=UPI002482EA2D|nr:hypothetical protein [Polyangium sp. y55x31]MDI1480281.1 hypothetical protein [Polyangium sp. y55x31]
MRDDAISHVTAGVVGGAVGTALMQRGMKASQRLPERLRPPAVRKDPGEFMVSKLEELRGRPLPRALRDVVAQGLHWGYGVTGGVVLGLATSRRHIPTLPSALLAGATMGTAIWAVGYAGWLPATKLTPPLGRQGARHVAVSVLGHVVFGIVAAAPIFLLDRKAEPGWKRVLRRLAG